MSLRATTAKGFAFESARLAVNSIVTTVRIVILARLLAPDALGLFALALALLTGLETLTNVNVGKYLIQRKELEPGLIGCAWLLGMGRGVVTCVATLLFAPLYGHSMREPAVAEVLYIVAFVALVRGFRSPGAVLAERTLDYKRITIFEVSMTVIETIIVVTLAVLMADAKALAWSLFWSAIIGVVASYFVYGMGGKFRVDWKSLRELIGVGRHFVVISVLSYLMIQGDNLIVGAMLGTTMLGYYVIAYKLVDAPLRLTFQVTNRVGFSALSRLQEDPKRMRDRFLELMDLQTALLFPLIAFVVVAAEPIVTALFGAKWAESVPIVRALGLLMLGRGISHIVVPFQMATGGYRIISKIKIIEAATFFLGVLIGCKLGGLVGVALGAGVGYAVAAVVRLRYLISVGDFEATRLMRHFGPVLLSLLVPIALSIASERILDAQPAIRLLVSGVVFSGSYGLITILGRPSLVRRIKETLREFRRPLQVTPAIPK